ncbi:hypothetical protein SAY86_008615 [Trapa natans]|uniref:RING-type domain-containing protein n=1 Tax=Trapa natans TaxID=22666 RepID=A0AAN7KFN6_TRANT|nr:hypothetical protein SAY86_008615 [Trapa natans]
MAGMLPGVEVARRRRLPRSGSWVDPPTSNAYASTRRWPSFCLHAGNSEGSSSYFMKKRLQGYDDCHGKLGRAAREAKERLDQRLRSQVGKSNYRRHDNTNQATERPWASREPLGLTRSMSKRIVSWVKMVRWKGGGAEQGECAVCLEKLMSGETLMNLPCNHRFHSSCLLPWLVSNSRCPCCRTAIPII